MKVENIKSTRTNRSIPNQFIIRDQNKTYFQSYNSIIVKKTILCDQTLKPVIELDVNYWNYSMTTSKYRNQFLGESTKETMKKIKSGEYILTNLN
jgi:hypothetical protein